MAAPSFIQANLSDHRDELLSLNIEYMTWVLAGVGRLFGVTTHDAIGMSVPEYVSGNLDKVCGHAPPRGVFYLVSVEGLVAGICGLRFLRPGVAEIKRIYVRPTHRGMNLGATALNRLLSEARDFGYERVCLDTAPFMQSAQRLYGAHGFVDCKPYEGVEVPSAFHSNWRFMARSLDS